jgi:hypothetical protein
MWRRRSTRRATLPAQILAVTLMLVLAGCASRASDQSYTQSDVQRAFQTQGIKLTPFDLGGKQYLLSHGDRYRAALSVWVRPPGSPDEFGIRLTEGHRLVTAENVVVTYQPREVSAGVISKALVALEQQ